MARTGKSGPLVETDLEFLGYQGVERLSPRDCGLPEQTSRFFSAQIQAGIFPDTHWFVYLLTECQNEDIQKVEKAVLTRGDIFDSEKCVIVVPKSMSERNALAQLKKENRVRVFEDLMWEKIQQIFSGYISEEKERIEHLQAEYYVEPQVENERGGTLSLKDLLAMFSDKRSREGILVVKADAGVGKTSLAAKITSELVKRWDGSRVVPLLLTGQADWRELAERAGDTVNLGDILISLLTADGADFPIRNIEQFTRIMQLGYFALVFDGFDELTKPSGEVPLQPQENLDWLADVATDSSARVMLTTRTSFWGREISQETANQHEVLSLKSFDSTAVSKYFRNHFSEKKNGDDLMLKAKNFYSKLQKSQSGDTTEDSFFNLPACAMMIAHQVEKGGDSDFSMDKSIQDPSRQLFMQILRRENIRQQTRIEPEKIERMHEVFEGIAISVKEFELDDIASDPECPIQSDDIEKIADHAFFKAKEADGASGKLVFKNDFLLHYLQASHIRRFILNESLQGFGDKYRNDRTLRDLRKRIDSEADGTGRLSEQVSRYLDTEDTKRVADLHKACPNNDALFYSLKSFLFHIIAKTVVFYGKGDSRKDRGDTILSLFGDKRTRRVSNLHVQGGLDEISLSDWTIQGSSFADFSLEKRGSHAGLRFTDCDFSGILWIPSGLGSKNFENCKGEGSAKLSLNEIGQEVITEDDIHKNLEQVLSRFWRRHAKTSSMSEDHWKTGVTTRIEKSYGLLEILEREKVVKRQEHSSRSKRIGIDRGAISDIKEFMENGIVKGRIKSVLERMKGKISRKR